MQRHFCTVHSVVFPGRSLAKIDGKVAFFEGGLPGEEVEIEIVEQGKRYDEAVLIDVVTPSDKRRKPKCAHFISCSPYQTIDREFQIQIKEEQLLSIFKRHVKLYTPDLEFHYRNKASFRFDRHHLCYTLYNDLVNVSHGCHLLDEEINKYIPVVEQFCQHIAQRTSINRVWIRKDVSSLYVVVEMDELLNVEFLSGICRDFSISNFKAKDRRGREFTLGGQLLTSNILEKDFLYPIDGFFQVNESAISIFANDFINLIRGMNLGKVVDLFGGCGILGILASDFAQSILSVDIDKNLLPALEANKFRSNRNFDYKILPAHKAVDYIENADTIILDPPRNGLSKRVLNAILASQVQKIFYLSCNPMTLKRDLDYLLRILNLKDIKAYDFFPNTGHIEVFAYLKRD